MMTTPEPEPEELEEVVVEEHQHQHQQYAIVDPRYHRCGYIGDTDRDVGTRIIEHISHARTNATGGGNSNNDDKQGWVREIISEGLRPFAMILPPPLDWELEHLPTVDREEEPWEKAERYWIWRFKLAGMARFNVAAGGAGQWGRLQSEETKQKISSSMRSYFSSSSSSGQDHHQVGDDDYDDKTRKD
jgi:hypothetical protein